MTTAWTQKQFTLPAKSRGSYLITDIVTKEVPEIKTYKVGILHLFMQHTSCGLSLNENWDSDVREDMSDALDRIAPEFGPDGSALYRHDAEGPDDMPVSCPFAAAGLLLESINRVLRRLTSKAPWLVQASQYLSKTASW